MIRLNKHTGFTMIEMMLAMVFVAMLLLAIAMTSIRMSHMYVRGLTLTSVDTAGQAVMKDIQRSVTNSPMQQFDVTKPQYFQAATATNAGKLCLGSISYVWNSGDTFNGSTPLRYTDPTHAAVHLAKVTDPGGAVCSGVPSVSATNSTELLPESSRNLVIESLTLTKVASDASSHQSLYQLNVAIGTNGSNGQALQSGNLSCKPPSDADNNFDYCAVSQFSMIIRSGNEGGA